MRFDETAKLSGANLDAAMRALRGGEREAMTDIEMMELAALCRRVRDRELHSQWSRVGLPQGAHRLQRR